MLTRKRTDAAPAGPRRRAVIAVGGLLLIALAAAGRDRLAPAVGMVETGPTLVDAKGTLFLCGGGRLPDSIRAAFVRRAGGPKARIVVIPTANPAADDPAIAARALSAWDGWGAASVEVLHARSRTEADGPALADQVRRATAVWIGGGNQGLVAATYAGTAVERELKGLLDRGGVVGGTSAGAAVQSRLTIFGGQPEAIVGRGLGLLPDAVIDQHFLRRNRLGRLLGVLQTHPGVVGLGVDEGTALVVGLGQGRLHVIGDSYVFACVPDADGGPPRFEVLKAGDEATLDALRRPDGAIATSVDFNALSDR